MSRCLIVVVLRHLRLMFSLRKKKKRTVVEPLEGFDHFSLSSDGFSSSIYLSIYLSVVVVVVVVLDRLTDVRQAERKGKRKKKRKKKISTMIIITSFFLRSVRMISRNNLPFVVFILGFFSLNFVYSDLTRHVTILGALTTFEHVKILNEQTNRSYSLSTNTNLYLSSQSFLLDTNPLLIAIKLCELGFASHAKSIIAGRGFDGNDLTLTAISYVSDFYHIPILTIASRENLFSDKVKTKTKTRRNKKRFEYLTFFFIFRRCTITSFD